MMVPIILTRSQVDAAERVVYSFKTGIQNGTMASEVPTRALAAGFRCF